MKSLGAEYNVYAMGKKTLSKHMAMKLFKQPNTLLIYVEPGTLQYIPDRSYDYWLPRSYKGVRIPDSIPFGFWWSGSIYRVDNHADLYKIPYEERVWFKKRRNYYNSLSNFKLVGTDDLLLVDRSAYHVGQPIKVPKSFPEKKGTVDRVIHIGSGPKVTDHYKGTDIVRRAFKKTEKFLPSYVIQGARHEDVLEQLKYSTMCVMTMTDWSSGLGYGGMEAIANGCMLISKNSNITPTKVVDARDVNQLTKKILYYHNHPAERLKIAKRQFKWLKNNYSMSAFRRRFNEALHDCVKEGWS